ncbi:response regulator transcription factor [Alicyclobacillus cycloheptanicus]|uniref:Two-component system response regulator DegU n=1 Tax=Alicyclobacillus cycloheptanicus TaxID=1457 RepID=A0ABT9XM07_9BACL|nr:response regulator transcription factor [Alicyclobacillus cycloheptanicus]MDQ0191350.1 two-component system response regulator DegU [Alicyclobacillus cycloheptanicus]WDL99833.1 response regulator transcription factor [Alicyclobacillus cycloheptanicus]
MAGVIKIYSWKVIPLLELGLQCLFDDQRGMAFCGGYQDLNRLLEQVQTAPVHVPQVIFVDYLEGYERHPASLSSLKAGSHQVRVIFLLPRSEDDALFMRALRAGADGYMLQSSAADLVLQAVRTVAAGKSYVGPEVAPVMLDALRKPMYVAQVPSVQLPLSDRERTLIQLAADGLSNAEIADALGLAEKTVRNLWSSLFEKLGMEDRTQAVLWAVRTGHAVLR